jgi:hypothetical protein
MNPQPTSKDELDEILDLITITQPYEEAPEVVGINLEPAKSKLQEYVNQKCLEARNEPVKIMGKTVDEIVVILSALELQRITDIEVTMSNLDKLAKKLQEDMRESYQKAINLSIESTLTRASL